ncbi:MAG TPA: hypothetical protein VF101_10610 [Gaiellaceae bacterium]
MDERARRLAENEALFRQVNERVKDLNRGFSVVLDRGDYLCECGSVECVDRVSLTPEEYERVRAEPTLFVVLPGHVAHEVESVVYAGDGYEVVRKAEGEPAEVARETDPRS